MDDIVIDADVMRLYDDPADPVIKRLFVWLDQRGSLAVSRKLMAQYGRQGRGAVGSLLLRMKDLKRLNLVHSNQIRAFTRDRHFHYTCNPGDHDNARLVFLSRRKRLVSFDDRFVADVNRFPKVDGVKPTAARKPTAAFYS